MILIDPPAFFSIAAIICSAFGHGNLMGLPFVIHEAITIVSAPLLIISAALVTAFSLGIHHRYSFWQLRYLPQFLQKPAS